MSRRALGQSRESGAAERRKHDDNGLHAWTRVLPHAVDPHYVSEAFGGEPARLLCLPAQVLLLHHETALFYTISLQ